MRLNSKDYKREAHSDSASSSEFSGGPGVGSGSTSGGLLSSVPFLGSSACTPGCPHPPDPTPCPRQAPPWRGREALLSGLFFTPTSQARILLNSWVSLVHRSPRLGAPRGPSFMGMTVVLILRVIYEGLYYCKIYLGSHYWKC